MSYLSLIGLLCFAAVVVNASDSGYYVPKGYYVIHADGQQSELSDIKPSHQLLLHRLRRRAQFSSSSSSSSSSVSSNGGPVFFHQSSSSHVSPGFPSQNYYPVSGSLNDRFNGDDDDDDDYDDGPVPFNNNRPIYSSSQTQTGTFTSNGFTGPTYTSTQTQTQNGFNRPSYTSTQTVTQNGYNRPTYTSTQTGNGYNNQPAYGPSGSGLSNRINTQDSGGLVASHTSSVSRPTGNGVQTHSTNVLTSNGNVVHSTQSNGNTHTQTSGIIYPNGQVQITAHKTEKF